jgi:phosphatidate cytidylyltransferase
MSGEPMTTVSKRATKQNTEQQSEGPRPDTPKSDYDKQLAAAGQQENKTRKLVVRLVFGWLLILILLAIIYAGHIYVCLFVAVLQAMMFRELTNVRYSVENAKQVPLFRTLQWCWFGVAMFYTYGEAAWEIIQTVRFIPPHLKQFSLYHSWISFSLYVAVFVVTVLSFKTKLYRYQMGQLTWTVVTIAMIVYQMKSIIGNILNGLFWFIFPACLIICNDTMAYFCGLRWGKKFINAPLLKLSPNKTWEGFIGGGILTVIFAFYWPVVLSKGPWSQWLLCPATGNQLSFHPSPLSCTPDPVFLEQALSLPPILAGVFGPTITCSPVQLHGALLGLFASVVAPFGGFFASAIKRAYTVKDFDSLIPGHGGVMDRMDCQLLMALCVAVHHRTFIRPLLGSVASIVAAVSNLPSMQQQEVLAQIRALVEGGG